MAGQPRRGRTGGSRGHAGAGGRVRWVGPDSVPMAAIVDPAAGSFMDYSLWIYLNQYMIALSDSESPCHFCPATLEYAYASWIGSWLKILRQNRYTQLSQRPCNLRAAWN